MSLGKMFGSIFPHIDGRTGPRTGTSEWIVLGTPLEFPGFTRSADTSRSRWSSAFVMKSLKDIQSHVILQEAVTGHDIDHLSKTSLLTTFKIKKSLV
jgi:hypothetical protein